MKFHHVAADSKSATKIDSADHMQLGLGLLTYLSTWALLVDLGDALNRESWGFAEPKDVSSGLLVSTMS